MCFFSNRPLLFLCDVLVLCHMAPPLPSLHSPFLPFLPVPSFPFSLPSILPSLSSPLTSIITAISQGPIHKLHYSTISIPSQAHIQSLQVFPRRPTVILNATCSKLKQSSSTDSHLFLHSLCQWANPLSTQRLKNEISTSFMNLFSCISTVFLTPHVKAAHRPSTVCTPVPHYSRRRR